MEHVVPTVCAVPDSLGVRESFRRGCYGHTEALIFGLRALIFGLSPFKLNKTQCWGERACVGDRCKKDDRDSLHTPKRSESACTRVLLHISIPTWNMFSSASYRDSLLQLDEISVPVEPFFFSSFHPLTVARLVVNPKHHSRQTYSPPALIMLPLPVASSLSTPCLNSSPVINCYYVQSFSFPELKQHGRTGPARPTHWSIHPD
jgi:hypothetical protein